MCEQGLKARRAWAPRPGAALPVRLLEFDYDGLLWQRQASRSKASNCFERGRQRAPRLVHGLPPIAGFNAIRLLFTHEYVLKMTSSTPKDS